MSADVERLAPPEGAAAAELAASAAEWLEHNLDAPVYYFLDDVQRLANSRTAETWLRTFVDLMPPSCRLIIMSRILPDLPFAQMIARREVQAIGQDDLRFTSDEIQKLAHSSNRPSMNVEQATRFADHLEGWPAGAVLSLYPFPAEIEKSMLSGNAGPEALFYELAGAMLETQPPDLRDFLLSSSTIRRMNPQLCADILQLPRAAGWLDTIQRNNLFVSRVPGGLSYHALFRSFLQETLKRIHPERFIKLHIRAAEWYQSQDKIEDAFDHNMSAGLVEEAAALADRMANAYHAQGRYEIALSWNKQLLEVGARANRLLFICARIHTQRYEYDLAREELSMAEHGFLDRGDMEGVVDCRLEFGFITMQTGAFPDASEVATTLLQQGGLDPKRRAYALRILGVSKVQSGDVTEGAVHLREAEPLYRDYGDKTALTNLLFDMQTTYLRLGQFDEAAACLHEIVAIRRELGSKIGLAAALNNLGYHYYQHGNHDEALAALREGQSIVSRIPGLRIEAYLMSSMGDLVRDRGSFDEARQLYYKALELVGNREPTLQASVLAKMSMVERWSGDAVAAVDFAEQALAIATEHTIVHNRLIATAALETARYERDRAYDPIPGLNQTISEFGSRGSHIERLFVNALLASVAISKGDDDKALAILSDALGDLEPESGGFYLFLAEVLHNPALLDFVTDQPRIFEKIQARLTTMRDPAVTTHGPNAKRDSDSNAFTYSVRVFALGNERFERDGRRINSSDWRAVSARDLFLYLLFEGPADREAISAIFWENSPPNKVRKNFHTTLYRARSALGENVIRYDNPLYRIDDTIDLWSDAHAFQEAVEQARHLPPRDARTEDLWRRAVNLYRGDLLPSLYEDWIYLQRETFRDTYIEALVGLGSCALARGAYSEAADTYKSALGVDPYREEIYRAIFACYAEAGEHNKIRQQYEEMRSLFEDELGIEPSEQTDKLVTSLLT